MNRLKLFLPLIIFVALAAVLLRGLDRDPNAMPSALIDRPMPAFSKPSLLEPQLVLNESVFKGQPALLNVWATWCPSCRVEHPYLLQLAAQGVRIVGLNYKDDSDAARQLLRRTGNPYEINIEDRDGRLGIDLGVFGAPETYLVDAEGVIRFKHVGVVNERIWTQIEPLYQRLLAGVDN